MTTNTPSPFPPKRRLTHIPIFHRHLLDDDLDDVQSSTLELIGIIVAFVLVTAMAILLYFSLRQ